MKQKLALLTVLAVALCAIWFSGCTTANPNYNPNQPPSPTNEPYSVDPRLLSISNSVAQATHALAPVNPYAGITDYAQSGIFGLIGLIAGGVAAWKNRQAVVNTMAAGVVKAGPVAAQAVLDHASTQSDSHFTAISQAINASTGANQTSTGAPKT